MQRCSGISAGVDEQVRGLVRDCVRGTNLTGLIREGHIYGSVYAAVNAIISTGRVSIPAEPTETVTHVAGMKRTVE